MNVAGNDISALPDDRRVLAQNLFGLLSSYVVHFDQQLLLEAIKEARLDLPQPSNGSVLFGNPLLLAARLAEYRQTPETIIASLLYASVKMDSVKPKETEQSILAIQSKYGSEIAGIVAHALELAHMHRPKLGDRLLRRMMDDNRRYRTERAAARDEEQRHRRFTAARHAAQKNKDKGALEALNQDPDREARKEVYVEPSLYDRWLSRYAEFLQSLNFDPRAEAIRVGERDLLIDTINDDKPTSLDLMRAREAMEVQGPMALRLGMYQVYDKFGETFLKLHHPKVYDFIAKGLGFFRDLLGQVGAAGSVLAELEKRVEALYGAQGIELKRAKKFKDFEEGRGDYFISVREKKPFSIWRKLMGDGIDPEDILRDMQLVEVLDAEMRDRLLISEVFQNHVYDTYGFRVIFHKNALLERGLIEPQEKPMHEARDGCDFMRDVLMYAAKPIDAEDIQEGDFLYDPSRRKDYVRNPKPNGFRSLQEGFALLLASTKLGRFFLRAEGQFRTHSMHIHAEYGTAAHVGFKLSAIHVEKTLAQAKPKCDDYVYLFTPQGGILKLRKGATVADAAFQISRDLGVKCMGALVTSGYKTWHPFFNSWRYGEEKRYLKPGDALQSGFTIEIREDPSLKPTEARLAYLEGVVKTDAATSMLAAMRPKPPKLGAENLKAKL